MIYDRDPTLSSGLSVPVDPPRRGGVEFEGTVGDSVASDRFKFAAASDSNVVVRVLDGDTPHIEIGVYYV